MLVDVVLSTTTSAAPTTNIDPLEVEFNALFTKRVLSQNADSSLLQYDTNIRDTYKRCYITNSKLKRRDLNNIDLILSETSTQDDITNQCLSKGIKLDFNLLLHIREKQTKEILEQLERKSVILLFHDVLSFVELLKTFNNPNTTNSKIDAFNRLTNYKLKKQSIYDFKKDITTLFKEAEITEWDDKKYLLMRMITAEQVEKLLELNDLTKFLQYLERLEQVQLIKAKEKLHFIQTKQETQQHTTTDTVTVPPQVNHQPRRSGRRNTPRHLLRSIMSNEIVKSTVPIVEVKVAKGRYVTQVTNWIVSTAHVDSGATINVMSTTTLNTLFPTIKPMNTGKIDVELGDGSTTDSNKMVLLHLKLGESIFKSVKFYLLESTNALLLLGAKFLDDNEAKLDFSKHELVVKNETIKYLRHYIRITQPTNLVRLSTTIVKVPLTEKADVAEYYQIHPLHDTRSVAITAVASIHKNNTRMVQVPMTNLTEDNILLPAGTIIASLTNLQVKEINSDSCNTNNNNDNKNNNNSANNDDDSNSNNTQCSSEIWKTIKDRLSISDDISKSIRNKLIRILKKHAKLFAMDRKDNGCITNFEMSINTGDTTPISSVPYRYSPIQKKAIELEIKHLLECNLIEKANSPWGFPVVLAVKQDGTYRFCVDYRKLNACTIKDSYPLPTIQDSLDMLGGSCYFSALDMMSGYWQIKVNRTHRGKTTFVSHMGAYAFKGCHSD